MFSIKNLFFVLIAKVQKKSFKRMFKIKNQIDFPNWFQEWWLFFGSIKDILCPQILDGYNYFDEHGSHLVTTSCSKVLFFPRI